MSRPGTELNCLSELIKGMFSVRDVAAMMQSGNFKFVDFLISIVFFLLRQK